MFRLSSVLMIALCAASLNAQASGWVQETVSAQWSGRSGHASVAYDNKLWILGGRGASLSLQNDVWYSADGVSWTQATPAAPWSARHGHTVTVFQNRMWLIGGEGPSFTYFQDVWSSVDGVTWTLETSTGVTAAHHTSVVYNGKLWILGGRDGSVKKNVWSSADGTNWVFVAVAPWTGLGRIDHSSVVFNSRMWVIGGRAPNVSMNDVWSSSDGVNWTMETGSAGWSIRYSHASEVFNNRIWVFAGSDLTPSADVWASSDGINWTQEAATVPWSGRSNQTSGVFNSRLWLAGGFTGTSTPNNSVWSFAEPYAPQITSAPVVFATAGVNYTYDVQANGLPLPTFGATGLPGWLTLSGNTLSGMPGVADVGVTGTITVTSTNSEGSDSQMFQITVNDGLPQITSSPSTAVLAGSSYVYAITATGNPPPSFSATGLPSWLGLSGNVLSGTPGAADVGLTGTIDITAANGLSPDDVQTFTIDVVGVAPSFTTTPVVDAQAFTPYAYPIGVAGSPAPVISVSGGLPSWLSFNPATGELSGTPMSGEAGSSFNVTLVASNGLAPDAVQTFTVTVGAASLGGKSGDSGGGGCAVGGGALLPLLLPVLLALRRRRS